LRKKLNERLLQIPAFLLIKIDKGKLLEKTGRKAMDLKQSFGRHAGHFLFLLLLIIFFFRGNTLN